MFAALFLRRFLGGFLFGGGFFLFGRGFFLFGLAGGVFLALGFLLGPFGRLLFGNLRHWASFAGLRGSVGPQMPTDVHSTRGQGSRACRACRAKSRDVSILDGG